MSKSPPLDLSAIDPPVWRVFANGQTYGPYTLGQLQAFIADKRLHPNSQVAKGDGAPILKAGDVKQLQAAFQDQKAHTLSPQAAPQSASNYVVFAKLSADHEPALVEVLNRLGTFADVMTGVYVLRSTLKLATVQKAIRMDISSETPVLIVNASTDRLAWFNLGPEADDHLQHVWDKTLSET